MQRAFRPRIGQTLSRLGCWLEGQNLADRSLAGGDDSCARQLWIHTSSMSSPPPAEHEQMLAGIRSLLSEQSEVAAAYLYGSTARGSATPLSDLDLAILPVEGLDESRRARLQREMAGRLGALAGALPVDVRFFDELPLAVRGRVLYEGALVVDRDPALRVRTEVRTRMEYHDFQYFERSGAQEWIEAARERLRRG